MAKTTAENKIRGIAQLAPRLAVLVVLAVAVILAFVLLFNKSLGWFANNRDVSGSGMKVTTDADRRANISVDAVKYDLDRLSFAFFGTDGLQMNEHDTIFVDRNTYTPMVLRVKLTGGVYEPGQVFHLDMKRLLSKDGTALPSSGEALPSYITSVLRLQPCTEADFSGAYMKATYSGTVNPEDVYNDVETYFKSGAGRGIAGRTFTSLSQSGYSKVDELSFAFMHTGASTMYVYFYLTYDDALMSDYLKQHVVSVGSAESNIFRLENDIEYLRIED